MSADGEPRPVVDLVPEDARWEIAGLAAVAETAARAALNAARLDPMRFEVSLLAADNARVAELNQSYRGKAGPTNVLSWPTFEGDAPEVVVASIREERPPPGEPVFLGDLALAYETCAAEATDQGVPLVNHVAHLIVHGVFHLLGYNHDDEHEAEQMETLERKTLASLGVPDPYSQ